MPSQALLGPNEEEGPTADPFLLYTSLACLCISTATPWLHDTTTPAIMELVIIALLLLSVSWLGIYVIPVYFAIFSLYSFHTLVIARLTSDSACGPSLLGSSPIAYSHTRFA